LEEAKDLFVYIPTDTLSHNDHRATDALSNKDHRATDALSHNYHRAFFNIRVGAALSMSTHEGCVRVWFIYSRSDLANSIVDTDANVKQLGQELMVKDAK